MIRRLLAAALLGSSGLAGAPTAALELLPSPCTTAILAAEERHDLPDGLLMAIGFGEAGRKVEGGVTIWPWTVNVGGQGHYFTTRAEATAFVARQRAAGQRSIDVGCLQINLRWHPAAFADLQDAFEPMRNADYAARFLRALRAQVGGAGESGWMAAAGSYHSATPARAEPYRAHVARTWRRLGDPVLLAALDDKAAPPAGRGNERPAVRLDDPFGQAIGPDDGALPLLDLASRPVIDIEAGSKSAPSAQDRQRRPGRPQAIRRFRPLPAPVEPATVLPTRTGIMAGAARGR